MWRKAWMSSTSTKSSTESGEAGRPLRSPDGHTAYMSRMARFITQPIAMPGTVHTSKKLRTLVGSAMIELLQ